MLRPGMLRPMQLSQVMLFVVDLPRMQAFYADLLGMPVLSTEPGFVRLGSPGAALALHAIPAEYAGAMTEPATAREDTAIKPCFRVDDVSAEHTRLVGLGVPMRPLHQHDALAYCDGIDPEGNVFQLSSR